MPNRILKDSVCTSPTIDALGREAELFFYRLIVQCDDFGRMDARPAMLRARCYPLRLDSVSDHAIAGWLKELVEVGLVWTYRADGGQYLQVTKWTKHQQIRAKRSKFPQPAANGDKPPSSDINGYQVPSADINSARESESESESESEKDSGAETAPPASQTDRQAALANLERRFLIKTGLVMAKRKTREEKRAAATRWWHPLGRVLDLAGGSEDAAWELLEAAVDRMRAGRLTISAPQSVEKTVEAIVGERKSGGQYEHQAPAPHTPQGGAPVRRGPGLSPARPGGNKIDTELPPDADV